MSTDIERLAALLEEVTAERLAAIEARLKAATPGPWFWTHHTGAPFVGNGDKAANLVAGAYGVNGAVLGTDYRTPTAANARLIANAPTDIRYLLDLARGVTFGNPESAPLRDEIAWLVEGQGDGRPVWWTGKWWPRFAKIVHGPLHGMRAIPRTTDDMEPKFSPEHLDAMRFARKEDAERAIELLPVFYRPAVKAIEHRWVAALREGAP